MFLGLNRKQTLLVGAGLAIVATASVLGIVLRFNHFYEFALIGMATMLVPFTPREVWESRRLVKMYVLFVLAALVIDLVLGMFIARLWHYSYTTFFEYVVLYLWIYPLGGFVLVQSYLAARRLRPEPEKQVLQRSVFVYTTIVLVVAAVTTGCWLWYSDSPLSRMFFATAVALALCAGAALRCELRGKRSYLRDMCTSFPLAMGAMLLATFGNLLVHEYPNVYAQEWIYTSGTPILGVPLFIWCTWPLLTIGSLSLYYMTDRGYPKS